jgi:hypothetical protein
MAMQEIETVAWKTFAVYSENRMKPASTLCGQNAGLVEKVVHIVTTKL